MSLFILLHFLCAHNKPKGGYNLNMYPADTTYPAIQGEGVQSWV